MDSFKANYQFINSRSYIVQALEKENIPYELAWVDSDESTYAAKAEIEALAEHYLSITNLNANFDELTQSEREKLDIAWNNFKSIRRKNNENDKKILLLHLPGDKLQLKLILKRPGETL